MVFIFRWRQLSQEKYLCLFLRGVPEVTVFPARNLVLRHCGSSPLLVIRRTAVFRWRLKALSDRSDPTSFSLKASEQTFRHLHGHWIKQTNKQKTLQRVQSFLVWQVQLIQALFPFSWHFSLKCARSPWSTLMRCSASSNLIKGRVSSPHFAHSSLWAVFLFDPDLPKWRIPQAAVFITRIHFTSCWPRSQSASNLQISWANAFCAHFSSRLRLPLGGCDFGQPSLQEASRSQSYSPPDLLRLSSFCVTNPSPSGRLHTATHNSWVAPEARTSYVTISYPPHKQWWSCEKKKNCCCLRFSTGCFFFTDPKLGEGAFTDVCQTFSPWL